MPDAFQTFAEEFAVYGYPVLFAGVFLENMGVPVPGETAVLVAGFLASPAGGEHFQLGWVIVLTAIAAVLGDNLGFYLGHRLARPRLQQGRRFLLLTPKMLELAEGYFARYGLWTIFFARFITGLRVIGAVAAGTAGMPWPRFLAANAGGAVVWAVSISLLGYFFGRSWERLHYYLGRGGMILLGSVVLLIALPYLLRRLRHMRLRPLESLTAAQVVQGLLVAVLEIICVALLFLLAKGRHATALDVRVAAWTAPGEAAAADALALLGNGVACLLGAIGWTALTIGQLAYRRRPWREMAVMCWAFLGSEAVGLLLVGLLHAREVAPRYMDIWPHGFAALLPLRALAVLGMAALLVCRQDRRLGRGAQALAALLTLLAGFSVIWTGAQTFTETMLEYAAASVVLFAGLWWLEGYGRGLMELPPETGKR